jgi:hypothetical protein
MANPGPVLAERPDFSISDVVSFPPPNFDDVRGVSLLKRTTKDVSMILYTTDLEPGVYTIWWVVINPGQDSADFDLGYAAGHVVGRRGKATFAAHLKEGDPLTERSPLGTLEDAREAESRLVVRYHGPIDPGRLKEQLTTFEPGLDTDGDPGTGNVQISFHVPE